MLEVGRRHDGEERDDARPCARRAARRSASAFLHSGDLSTTTRNLRRRGGLSGVVAMAPTLPRRLNSPRSAVNASRDEADEAPDLGHDRRRDRRAPAPRPCSGCGRSPPDRPATAASRLRSASSLATARSASAFLKAENCAPANSSITACLRLLGERRVDVDQILRLRPRPQAPLRLPAADSDRCSPCGSSARSCRHRRSD